MTTTQRLLELVQEALDEFDRVPLSVTVRRATRLASLLGEEELAIRFKLENLPMGGHPPANADDTRRLMTDPSTWGQPDSPVEAAVESWSADRRREDGKIFSHSLLRIE